MHELHCNTAMAFKDVQSLNSRGLLTFYNGRQPSHLQMSVVKTPVD